MWKRILIYFYEMFPLPSWIGTWLGAVMVLNLAQRLGGHEVVIDWTVAEAGIAVCLFTLLIRVMDEFKDYQDDLINFPSRPLPSRRVRFFDLKVVGWCCVIIPLLLSLYSWMVFAAALAVLLYSCLMLKWFFNEKAVRSSLPLAFLTHHPIVIFHAIYLLTVAKVAEYNTDPSALMSLLPISLIGTNWEISRKIRAPADETAYTTYSKVWGPRVASGITVVIQLAVLGTGLYFFMELGHPVWRGMVFAIGYAVLMIPAVWFLFTLKPLCTLRASAEAQLLWMVAGLLVAVWVP